MQTDHFAERFICESFSLQDLIRLINNHSARIEDILIDFRFLTIIYITYNTKSAVVGDKLMVSFSFKIKYVHVAAI